MKDFIPSNEALELKHLEFDEPCLAWYSDKQIRISGVEGCVISFIPTNTTLGEDDDLITAPTFSQAFRFFREKYGLNHEIPYAGREGEYHAFVQNYIYGNNGTNPSVFTYEEAELECLKKLIQIVKQKQ